MEMYIKVSMKKEGEKAKEKVMPLGVFCNTYKINKGDTQIIMNKCALCHDFYDKPVPFVCGKCATNPNRPKHCPWRL